MKYLKANMYGELASQNTQTVEDAYLDNLDKITHSIHYMCLYLLENKEIQFIEELYDYVSRYIMTKQNINAKQELLLEKVIDIAKELNSNKEKIQRIETLMGKYNELIEKYF